MADLFIKGLLVHLFVDFFLQSDWIADNKVNIRHPAAWLHGSLNVLGLLLVFTPEIAVGLGLSHMLIDTRYPLAIWRRWLRQNPQGEDGRLFRVLQDQSAHLILLGAAAFLSTQ